MNKTAFKIIVRVLIFLAVLELLPRLGSRVFTFVQDIQNKVTATASGKEFRIVCLGESTTALGGENSYPRQLERILNERQNKIRFKVINKATPAMVTTQIVSRLDKYFDEYQPRMAIAMIGINDASDSPLVLQPPATALDRMFHWSKTYQLGKFVVAKIRHTPLPGEVPPDPVLVKLENEVKQHPTSKNYSRLSSLYRITCDLVKEKAALDMALALDPNNLEALGFFAMYHQRLGEYSQAIPLFQKVIQLTPGESDEKVVAYEQLAQSYKLSGQYDEAERVFREEVQYLPFNPKVYGELGNLYLERGQFPEAAKLYIKQLRMNPQNAGTYGKLAHCYRQSGHPDMAEHLLQEGFNINPGSSTLAMELGVALLENQKFAAAEEIFEKALHLSDKNESAAATDIYRYLLQCYTAQNKFSEADQIKKLLTQKKVKANPMTAENYRIIYDKTKDKKCRLIAMQYPLRDASILGEMLPGRPDVIFVNNQKTFQKAITAEGYDAYFLDRFAGDFGHCTAKGNQLIAEQLAETILRSLHL